MLRYAMFINDYGCHLGERY